MILSKREEELPRATIGKLLKISSESKDIISLGPGEPDFATPEFIIKAAKKALDSKFTHYTSTTGISELKEEIAKKLKKENKINAGPENIIVTCGSTEAIFLSLLALIDPGEEVLVPDPGFLAYIPSVEILTAYPVSVKLDFEQEFEFTSENLKNAIKDQKKVKALIINTPSNPTGTVLSKKSLEEIADIAIEHDIIVIADEAYEHFIYEGKKHISIASLNGLEDRVITLQSFSKSFAMPGFRIGYACAPEKIIWAMAKLHIYSSLCAPNVSQHAALEALKNKKEAKKSVREMVNSYNKRRKLIVSRIKEINGFEIKEPYGAFYAFPKFNFKIKAYDLSEFLIKDAKVATVPGTEFGRYGEGFLRFSYATAYEKIEIAMNRIEKAVEKLK